MSNSYDAILIVSFGGPEGLPDVMPFLENVTRGRNVPHERLLEVAKHYEMFGGVSPINGQNRAMIEALEKELAEKGPKLPVYWGNRNWHLLLADTLEQMRKDGIKRAIAFVTSAFSSYSGCRQYLDDITRAQEKIGEGAPQIDKVRPYFNHPLFFECNLVNLKAALEQIPADRAEKAHIVFTAHSIPMGMSQGCNYAAQLSEFAALLAAAVGSKNWSLAYQSRSGPPQVPWLEPDILDQIRSLNEQGASDLVVHPIGFVSDHMEVIYDLDHEAKDLCDELGVAMHRVKTPGTHPLFIEMIRQVIAERAGEINERPFVGSIGALPDQCIDNCCPSGMSRPVSSAAPARESK